MGFKTTIAKASTIANSFRTTVPAGIMNQFNLNEGDKLDWSIEVKDGKLIIFIKPLHQKQLSENEKKIIK